MVTDVLPFLNEPLETSQITVERQHLNAESDRNSFVAIFKAVKLAGTKEEMCQLSIKCRVIVVVLDVLQN